MTEEHKVLLFDAVYNLGVTISRQLAAEKVAHSVNYQNIKDANEAPPQTGKRVPLQHEVSI